MVFGETPPCLPIAGADWKNNTDLPHSCPRDYRLSVCWGPIECHRTSQLYCIEGFKGGPELVTHVA